MSPRIDRNNLPQVDTDELLSRGAGDVLPIEAVRQIPIEECGESLVAVSDLAPRLSVRITPERQRYADGQDLLVRETVHVLLEDALADLSKALGLVLYDAFRPMAYQELLYDRHLHGLRVRQPGLDTNEARRRAFEYVFDPGDSFAPPPHTTGGALDISLFSVSDGLEMDMGCRYLDDSPKRYTNTGEITDQQRANRRRLVCLLGSVGFTSYPGEWWHFMLGDQEWAAYENQPFAYYGRVDQTPIRAI